MINYYFLGMNRKSESYIRHRGIARIPKRDQENQQTRYGRTDQRKKSSEKNGTNVRRRNDDRRRSPDHHRKPRNDGNSNRRQRSPFYRQNVGRSDRREPNRDYRDLRQYIGRERRSHSWLQKIQSKIFLLRIFNFS